MNNKKKPNILILYSDQHNIRTLGCYGNNQIHTPHLDRLANEGIKMNHAYTQNPICTPSRMCLLSGQYVHNFGYYGLMGNKPDNLPNMFEHFKTNGYTTGVAGKIHTPAGWVASKCDYVRDGYGFETKLESYNKDHQAGCQGMQGDDYSIYLAEQDLYKDRDDKILHEWYQENGHAKGQCLDARHSRIPKEHSIEAWTAKCTIEFIEKAVQKDTPFCFWMTMPRPHQTYAASKEFWELYEKIDLELPLNCDNDMEGRSNGAKSMQKGFQQDKGWIAFGPKDFNTARERVLKGYYACVSQMDDAIGQVLNKLDELNIRENTIIVYTTDHGEFAGEHGMIEKAPGIGFGCVTRIPMIFSWPGKLEQGKVRDSIIESIDIFPTVCHMAGIEEPNWVDGKNASELLEADQSIKDFAVTENANTKTIHTKQYKLTQYLPEFQEEDFGELFDIEKDPYELKNLYFEPEYQAVVQDLRYKLYCWLVRTTRVVTVNPKMPGDIDWEFAGEYGLCGKDGKVGEKFYKELIDKGITNYL